MTKQQSESRYRLNDCSIQPDSFLVLVDCDQCVDLHDLLWMRVGEHEQLVVVRPFDVVAPRCRIVRRLTDEAAVTQREKSVHGPRTVVLGHRRERYRNTVSA